MHHLAILHEPFASAIFSWRKTIESRFTKNRIAPYNKIKSWDKVLIKIASWPVTWEFVAWKVLFFDLEGTCIKAIKSFSKELASDLDPSFWESRKDKRYVTLIETLNVQKYDYPYKIDKKDRSAWKIIP